MDTGMKRLPCRRRTAIGLSLVYLISTACDDTTSLLDFEALHGYLDLTPAQTEVISGHARGIIAEVETYIRTVRQVRLDLGRSRSRVDDPEVLSMPQVVEARTRASANIQKIAAFIQAELTEEQLAKFDRIVMPDLQGSPQELEFMMARSRRDTFTGLGVRPTSDISLAEDVAGMCYNDLKNLRTLVFGPGGNRSGIERFPLIVTATLYDSILIEAEIAHISASVSTTRDEALQAHQTNNMATNKAHGMFTIRLILSTFLHESYVNPDRWVIFVEDHEGNQFEPDNIIESFEMEAPDPSSLDPLGNADYGGVAMTRKSRQIEIRFPYQDPFGRAIFGQGTKLLRLVLFDKNDLASRTHGEWRLK